MHTMEMFADDELVKVFLRGFLDDERVHGVPFDALPPEIELTFETKQQNAKEIAEMTAFCTAMQCDTERHSVSLLQVKRTRFGGANFQLVNCVKILKRCDTFCSLHIVRRDLVPERKFNIVFRTALLTISLMNMP